MAMHTDDIIGAPRNPNLFVGSRPTALLRPVNSYATFAQHFAAANKEYLTCASNASLRTGDVTCFLEANVYLDSTADKYLLGKEDEYALTVTSTKMRFQVKYDGTWYGVSATDFGNVTTATWYHVVGTHDADANTIAISVNNVSTSVAHTIGITPSSGAFTIGNAHIHIYMDGRIADVIFSKSGAVISHWKMDNSGTQYDAVGTNHLTPASVPLISPTVNNGGFETAGAGGADVFASWTEYSNGATTINRDITDYYNGSASCRIDIGADNGSGYIYQNVLIQRKNYAYSVRAKGSTAGQSFYVRGNSSSSNTTFMLTTAYAEYAGSLTADAAAFLISRNPTASSSIWFDDITLESTGPTRTAGITKRLAIVNDPVSDLLDSSINLKHFTQSDYTKRPLLSTLGEKPALLFDGVNDALYNAADLIGTGDVTVMAVIRADGSGGGGYGAVIHNSKFNLTVRDSDHRITVGTIGIADAVSAIDAIAHGISVVVAATRTAAGITNIYINAVLSGTANQSSGTAAGGATYIGNRAAGDRGFNGPIAELLIAPSIIPLQWITSITAYWRNYYGF